MHTWLAVTDVQSKDCCISVDDVGENGVMGYNVSVVIYDALYRALRLVWGRHNLCNHCVDAFEKHASLE